MPRASRARLRPAITTLGCAGCRPSVRQDGPITLKFCKTPVLFLQHETLKSPPTRMVP